jgi:hypothetical protein
MFILFLSICASHLLNKYINDRVSENEKAKLLRCKVTYGKHKDYALGLIIDKMWHFKILSLFLVFKQKKNYLSIHLSHLTKEKKHNPALSV